MNAKERKLAAQRVRRSALRDCSVPRIGNEKAQRINLGLALLSSIALPKVAYSSDEIAAWAGCSEQTIQRIEQAALRKVRCRLLPFLK